MAAGGMFLKKLAKNHKGLNCNDDDQDGGRMYKQPGKCIYGLNCLFKFAKN